MERASCQARSTWPGAIQWARSATESRLLAEVPDLTPGRCRPVGPVPENVSQEVENTERHRKPTVAVSPISICSQGHAIMATAAPKLDAVALLKADHRKVE